MVVLLVALSNWCTLFPWFCMFMRNFLSNSGWDDLSFLISWHSWLNHSIPSALHPQYFPDLFASLVQHPPPIFLLLVPFSMPFCLEKNSITFISFHSSYMFSRTSKAKASSEMVAISQTNLCFVCHFQSCFPNSLASKWLQKISIVS